MKAIIQRVYLQSSPGKYQLLKINLKKRPVDISKYRLLLEARYKSKVLFDYESLE